MHWKYIYKNYEEHMKNPLRSTMDIYYDYSKNICNYNEIDFVIHKYKKHFKKSDEYEPYYKFLKLIRDKYFEGLMLNEYYLACVVYDPLDCIDHKILDNFFGINES